jgi:hypothetical protein
MRYITLGDMLKQEMQAIYGTHGSKLEVRFLKGITAASALQFLK